MNSGILKTVEFYPGRKDISLVLNNNTIVCSNKTKFQVNDLDIDLFDCLNLIYNSDSQTVFAHYNEEVTQVNFILVHKHEKQ